MCLSPSPFISHSMIRMPLPAIPKRDSVALPSPIAVIREERAAAAAAAAGDVTDFLDKMHAASGNISQSQATSVQMAVELEKGGMSMKKKKRASADADGAESGDVLPAAFVEEMQDGMRSMQEQMRALQASMLALAGAVNQGKQGS